MKDLDLLVELENDNTLVRFLGDEAVDLIVMYDKEGDEYSYIFNNKKDLYELEQFLFEFLSQNYLINYFYDELYKQIKDDVQGFSDFEERMFNKIKLFCA